MRRLAIALLILSALSTSAFAATPQERMKSCNADATTKALKGDERKAFMSTCLKADSKPATPQERMKTCNADATTKALKGDERKAFMSECLKKK
ncbi:MAG: PsiF family protein [Pseudomonas sp.]